jgi:hypothetical protein
MNFTMLSDLVYRSTLASNYICQRLHLKGQTGSFISRDLFLMPYGGGVELLTAVLQSVMLLFEFSRFVLGGRYWNRLSHL